MKTLTSIFAVLAPVLLAGLLFGIHGFALSLSAETPAEPGEVTEIKEVSFHLQAGQEQPFRIRLGIDPFEAEYSATIETGRTWPEELRAQAEVQELEGGERVLQGRIVADRCCAEGTYEAKIWISISSQVQGAASLNRVAVPFEIYLTEGGKDLCPLWLAWLRWLGASLFFGAIAFYLWSMYRNCYFIRAEDLAGRLQPLINTDRSVPENLRGRLENRIRNGLSWRPCLAAWWAANPFKVGIPGRTYHQTAKLLLNNRLDKLNVSLMHRPELDPKVTIQHQPTNFRGLLFVRAKTRNKLEIFGVPDQENRLSSLQRQRGEPTSELQLTPIDRKEDLLVSDGQDVTSELIGWRILPSPPGGSG